MGLELGVGFARIVVLHIDALNICQEMTLPATRTQSSQWSLIAPASRGGSGVLVT